MQKIQSLYEDDPYGLVVAPYAKLGSKIAATAWNEPAYSQNQDANFDKVDPGHGFVLMCKSFDKGRTVRLSGQAPEQGGRALSERQGHGPRPVTGRGYASRAGVAKLAIRA